MVKQLGPSTAVVSIKELGTNCWLPKRFVEKGSRCDRVYTCKYPEKKECQAVLGEIEYLRREQEKMRAVIGNIDKGIDELQEMQN